MDEEKMTSLINLKKNQNAMIVSIDSNWQSIKRLSDLGLTPKTPIKMLRKTLFLGPIEIEVRGCRLALGRGIASKIIVNEV